MPIKTISYLDLEGNLSPSFKHTIADVELIKAYRAMELTRHIDERMITLQRQGSITFAMSSRGEEACAIATAAALQQDDWIYPQYRESGVMFWRGYTPLQYIHHMFSNSEDIIQGRQMPNHFGSRELNVVTVSSPLGTQITHTAGAAYAMKIKNENAVALCFFGEGTSSEGDFHSGLNFAAVRKAPAIFFCRNNGYAISTPTSHQYASDGIAERGIGYGMTSMRVDGNDFFALHKCVTQAREHCLKGKGPVLIEAMTYRLGAHSTSDDPSQYRDDTEVSEWKKRCPNLRLRLYLERQNLWNEKEEKGLQQAIKEEVDKAIEVAQKSPRPPIETLVQDVYFEVPLSLQNQLEEVKKLFLKE